MVVDLRRVDEGEDHFSWSLQPADLGVGDDDLRVDGALTAVVEVRRGENILDVSSRVTGRVLHDCARCGESVARELDESLRLIAEEAEHATLGDESEDVITFEGEELDVTAPLRDVVMVATPMVVHCRPDCQGLCPQCGVNRNQESCSCDSTVVDPRWQALGDALRGDSDTESPEQKEG